MACDCGLVERDALEESKWHELDGDTPEQFARSDHSGYLVLVPVERIALRDLSSNFNHGYLHSKCQERDENEQPISENAREDVEFSELDESGIELIEELHENEDLEDHGVMQQLLRWAAIWQVLWQEPSGFPSCILKDCLWLSVEPLAAVCLCF